MESFLIQQLKKQNRSLKGELSDRDRTIAELQKNVKLSRHRETDNEVSAYADECLRLRTLLEQTLIHNDSLYQQQNNVALHEEAINVNGVRLQEAINAHEERLALE
jgi:flagellar biosynthesis/type III secretory pathway chaperone